MFLLRMSLIILLCPPLSAADIAREQRMAAEIEGSIIDGDPIYLKADGHKFLSILTETETKPKPKGAVIIMHGRGFHPDWVDVVNPLRVGLAEQGWVTLSIQLPVLEKHAKYYDYEPILPQAFPRIEKAIAFLRARGLQHITLLAHSCGVHMAMEWVRQRGDDSIQAYIGIGTGATDYKQPMRKPLPLAQMKIPVLDVYGKDDYPAVLRMAPQRLAMLRQAGHAKSSQIMVSDADHYFTDRGAALLAVVSAWLAKL